MKKIYKIVSVCVLAVLILSMLCACYYVDAGKMSKLKGTYKLTYCVKDTAFDGDVPNSAENLLETKNIVAYLVITGETYCYYIYKDNETGLYCKQVKATYTYSQEERDLIEYFEYNDGVSNISRDYPGSGSEKFAFHSKNKNLNYHTITHKVNGKVWVRTGYEVDYDKVNKATDLSYVEKELGVKLKPSSYNMRYFSSDYNLARSIENVSQANDLYVYDIYNINPSTMTATRYYKLKSDGIHNEQNNLALSYTERTDGMDYDKIKIGDLEYETDYGTLFIRNIKEDGFIDLINYFKMSENIEELKIMFEENYASSGEGVIE